MRIGLDLRMLGGGSGISRYISEVSRQVLEADKANEYVLFFNVLDATTRAEYSRFGHKMVETSIRHYSMAEQLAYVRILNAERLDLVHFPHFNVPIRYRGRFVVTIHDLTHTKFPGKKLSHVFHRMAYRAVLNNAVRRATGIIAVSQSTKNEVIEHFGVPADKIQVIYEGTSGACSVMDRDKAMAQAKERFGLSKPFLLYVGVWRRYKNLPALASVFSRLVDDGLDIELVLAGEPDASYPEIKDQVMAGRHKDRIRALGRVSDEDLNTLYNSCRMFVLPSKAEGFGLTALEAASCGVAIAASDIPTLREVLGQGAEFFDPENEDNMYDVLSGLVSSEQRLEELANAALARSKHFSWQAAGQETIKFYESTN